MDHLQSVIAARASSLGLSSYAIAKQAELDPQTVKRFVEGRCALNSRYVSRICEVLGLQLRPVKRGIRVS